MKRRGPFGPNRPGPRRQFAKPQPPKPPSGGPKLIAGRLSVHRDGFGFLIPDTPIEGVEGDIFLPPDVAAKGMHGDRAAVRITRFSPRDGRAEGDIVKILERAHTAVVGEFRVRRKGYYVKPHEERLQQWIEIPKALALPKDKPVDRIGPSAATVETPEDLDGMIVTAEIIEFPEPGQDAVGRVVEILGRPDDFGVDVEIMIRKHRIPHRFPPDVLEQARLTSETIADAEIARREDFRGLDIVTIDGETARDFDDAVLVTRLDDGRFELQVHIADVSHYVRPGTAIDREAAMRGTSVYFPDRAVPMLPLELSTGICSLKPQVDRLVLSAVLIIDHQGDVVGQRFTRGVIRSAERCTYTQVQHALNDKTPSRFQLMEELALLLNRRRTRRGAIDFDLPEPLIEFDEFGEMIAIRRSERYMAHRIIEEFMLAANEAVAGHCSRWPFVYRIHETPDPKKVIEFEQIASQFGASLGVPIRAQKFRDTTRHRDGRKTGRDIVVSVENSKVTAKDYQKLIRQIEGSPFERILNYLMLRSLKQARYSAENEGHFALASECYTHFTSPIRRYPDLLVHRVLSAMLDHEEAPYSQVELAAFAGTSSLTERRAADAERDLVEWKKVKFMVEHIGDEFPGLIVNTSKYGFFVELTELFVEGFVSAESIHGDRFGYHESSRRIVGQRTGKHYSIGDAVTVRLDKVGGGDRRLEFSLVTPGGGKQGKGRKARGPR
ncbi:MAG: VacB/RNase II family 3'-5' exoribonuclease [Bryobacteraceae bacterium]